MKPLAERSFSFVVNLWEERRDIEGADPTWRGSVVDVRDGRRVYFSTLNELTEFLEDRSNMTFARTRLWNRLLRHVGHR